MNTTKQQTLMTSLLAASWCLAMTGAAVWAGGGQNGSVQTRDGKNYAGKIELKAGNHVAVTPVAGAVANLDFKDVVRVTLADPAAVGQAVADSHLTAPWQQRDIGSVKTAGSAVEDKGVFTVRAAGWGIWGGKDSFHFVYQALAGDGDLIARVVDVPTEENPFFAGVTIRAGLDADSAEASVILRPGGGPRVNCRPINGSHKPPELKQQHWVRLYRAGNACTGFSSRDGTTWEPVGTVTVPLHGPVYAGLACAATANQDLVTAAFDQVSVRSEEGGGGPAAGLGLVDGSLLAGTAQEFDGKTLKYVDVQKVEHTLPAEAVAHLFMQPLPPDLRGVLPGGKVGVWLVNGDVLEGQVQKLSNGRFVVNSLVFGPQNPDYTQVLTALLRPVKTAGTLTVTTRDGTIYRCQEVTLDEGVATAKGGVAGLVRVNAEDLVKIKVEGVLR